MRSRFHRLGARVGWSWLMVAAVVTVGPFAPAFEITAIAAAASPAPAAVRPRRGGVGQVTNAAGAAKQTLPAAVLKKLRADLQSEDDKVVAVAAQALADSGDPAAADVLHEALTLGTHPVHAEMLLVALKKLKLTKSLEVFTVYSGNRNLKVRLAAVKALADFDDPAATKTLQLRLGDPIADVRAVAAESLAARHDTSVVPRLFALLSRNDGGAAGPLGRLAPLDMVPQIAELRGHVADGALATCLGEFLKRPGAADRFRLDVVRTLGRIPGPDATTALIEFMASLPEADTSAAKQEAEALIEQRGAL